MTLIKFPCKDDKSPGVSGWQTYQGAVNSAVVGYMIPEGLIVLDLDTYKGVTCSDVETALGCSLLWHEAELQKTRSGGHHYAFRVPHGCQLRQGSDLFGVEGFDTRVSGKGYIASGKGYEDLTLFGIDETLSDPDCLPELPAEALALLDVGFEVEDDGEAFDLEEVLNNQTLGLEFDEIRAYVEALPGSMAGSGGDWVDIGMGIYHETGGSEEGWKLFDEFSRKGGDSYNERKNRVRWESWDNKGKRAVTFATVIKKAGGRKVIAKDVAQDLLNVVKDADIDALQGDELVKKIKSATLDTIGREMLVQAYQGRFKELSGVKLPVGDVRKLLSEERESVDYDRPDWCANWVYVGAQSKFVNVNTLAALGGEGFNVRFGKKVPVNENGTKTSAVKFVSDYGFVESVEKTAYLPMIDSVIYKTSEGRILNTFNPRTVPSAAREFSAEGLEHIEYVKRHIKLLFGEDADIFTQWLAHQIQFPGAKIPWAPLIQSVQGVGKGIFRELLENCLGYANVGVVSPKLAISDFNGWATGRTVNILEELKIVGSNRYEAANALKPLITDKTITINDKGISAYTTINTANYIVFTNYRDAIPLEDSDRRWWVIYVPINELSDIKKITGIDQQTYFDQIWKAVREFGPQIRKWLLEVEITEAFKSLNVAPTTVHKQMMIATEKGGHDHVQEIKELIEKGGEFYCVEAISSADLFNAAVFEIEGFEMPTNKEKGRILKQLGYSQLPKVVKIDGQVKRVWVKHHMESKDIKNLFEVRAIDCDGLEIPF